MTGLDEQKPSRRLWVAAAVVALGLVCTALAFVLQRGRALLRPTIGVSGTFWYGGLEPVGAALILATTSMPETTLPNTA